MFEHPLELPQEEMHRVWNWSHIRVRNGLKRGLGTAGAGRGGAADRDGIAACPTYQNLISQVHTFADWTPLEPAEEGQLTELLERPQIPQQQMAAQDQADRRDLLRRASYIENLVASTEKLPVRSPGDWP